MSYDAIISGSRNGARAVLPQNMNALRADRASPLKRNCRTCDLLNPAGNAASLTFLPSDVKAM